MHDWQRVERREIRSELRGFSREGKMRYEMTWLIKERCAVCGLEHDETKAERVDH